MRTVAEVGAVPQDAAVFKDVEVVGEEERAPAMEFSIVMMEATPRAMKLPVVLRATRAPARIGTWINFCVNFITRIMVGLPKFNLQRFDALTGVL
jgi:hypothetical protein